MNKILYRPEIQECPSGIDQPILIMERLTFRRRLICAWSTSECSHVHRKQINDNPLIDLLTRNSHQVSSRGGASGSFLASATGGFRVLDSTSRNPTERNAAARLRRRSRNLVRNAG
jgi:hypothetical protein